jgi:hypothetical protein
LTLSHERKLQGGKQQRRQLPPTIIFFVPLEYNAILRVVVADFMISIRYTTYNVVRSIMYLPTVEFVSSSSPSLLSGGDDDGDIIGMFAI